MAVIPGNSESEKLVGTESADTISGNGGNDELIGLGGVDLLSGGDGQDEIDGGAGDDKIYAGTSANGIEYDRDILNGGADNDVIYAGTGDTVLGGSGDDTITLTHDKQFTETPATIDVYGGGGYDSFRIVRKSDTTHRHVSIALDEQRTSHPDADIKLMDVEAVDLGSSSATVYGGKNAETIKASRNGLADNISGGDGDDRAYIDDQDVFDGGDGVDTLDFSDTFLYSEQQLDIDLSASSEPGYESQAWFWDDTFGTRAHVGQITIRNVENVVGTSKGDKIAGSADANKLEGRDGNDELYGRGGSDELHGEVGDDRLYGEAGDDKLFGAIGNDLLEGGSENDHLEGGVGNDILDGGSENDHLEGGEGTDTLRGGDGDDTLVATSGADRLMGGAGKDTLIGGADGLAWADYSENATSVFLNLGEGGASSSNDVIEDRFENITRWRLSDFGDAAIGSAGFEYFSGGAGADHLRGGGGNDVLEGGDHADTLMGEEGDDTLVSGFGDAVSGGIGNDTIDLVDTGDAKGAYKLVADGGSDFDTFRLRSTHTDVVVSMGEFAETADVRLSNVERVEIGSVAAHVYGSKSTDQIVSGAQGDAIFGLGGDDVVYLTAPLTGEGDVIFGGEGNDTLNFASYEGGSFYRGVAIDLSSPGPQAWLRAASGSGYTHHGKISVLEVENIVGSAGADLLTGSEVANKLEGRDGADDLYGLGGDDELHGGDGSDDLFGGDGNDTLYGDLGSPTAEEDELDGGAGNDVLYGNGQDILYGGKGADRLIGDGSDQVTASYLRATEGLTIDFSNPEMFIMTGEAEGDQFVNINRFQLTNYADEYHAGPGGQWVYAEGGADRLYGHDGRDHLYAGDGDDYIEGGAGIDTIWAGEGKDTIVGGQGNDSIHTEQGADIAYGGAGDDTIYGDEPNASASEDELDDTLYGEDGNDDLWGGRGDNKLYGGNGNDYLVGGSGADYLEGGEGNDTIDTGGVSTAGRRDVVDAGAGDDEIRFGHHTNVSLQYVTATGGAGNDTYDDVNLNWHTIVEEAGGGIDTVKLRDIATWTIAEHFENVVADSDLASVLTGNAVDNEITGSNKSDTLRGEGGNDILRGGSGSTIKDTLIGGTGNDIYYADATDIVTEGENEGIDEVRTNAATYRLGANFENLTSHREEGFSPVAHQFFGNLLDNVITGGDRGDTLDGSEGNDTLVGGGGNDTLIGGAGNDWLIGGADTDSFAGGLGDDVFEVAANEVVTEHAGEGYDTVRTSAARYTLGNNIEHLTGTATTARQELYGNSLDNTITAGAGNDLLDGGDGSDLLVGGLGADRMAGGANDDTYYVQDAGDVVVEVAGGGHDTVRTTLASYTLAAGVEDLMAVTDTGGRSLTGNALNNTITGGSLDDTLAGAAGNDTLDGLGGSDTAVFSGRRSDYEVSFLQDGRVQIRDLRDGSPDGVDTLTSIERVAFADRTYLVAELNNRAPEAGNDSIEVDDRTTTGNLWETLLGNDIDPDGGDIKTIVVVNTDGTKGAITFDPNGTLLYSAETEALKKIPDGETVLDSFTYTVRDGFGAENTATVTVVVRGLLTDDDWISGSAEGDNIIGSDEADLIRGEGGDDTLLGGSGSDVLDGGAGNDTLYGDDVSSGVAKAARMGFAARATAAIPDASDTLTGGAGDDRLVGGAGDDLIDGGADDDTVVFSGNRLDYEVELLDDGTIRVTDTRDGSPDGSDIVANVETFTFANGSYTAEEVLRTNSAPSDLLLDDAVIAENASAGTVVGTVVGADPDGDALTYGLVDDAGGLFVIDPVTGELSTTQSFNREANASFEVLVRATDPAGLFVDCTFTITVEDVNEAPVAAGDRVAVSEDATSGNLWSQLLSNDADVDLGDVLSIASVDTSSTKGSVVFDASTQTLRYVADADAFDLLATGQKAVDSFTYTVTDKAGLTSTATVTVEVTGVADGKVLKGGNGKDTLTGTDGEDVITGDNGNDTLSGLGGADKIDGGNGNDVLSGGAGIDTLTGGNGDDKLDGGHGNDSLNGGLGQDQITGGAGDDVITGSNGHDLLTGGSGADTFVFGIQSDIDKILDFNPNEDKLEFIQGAKVEFHDIRDTNQDGVNDTILVHSLGGVVILLGVEYSMGPSLEEYQSAIWQQPALAPNEQIA